MKFYSTNNRKQVVDLRTAVMQGLAPDGGLYMLDHIPVLPKDFFSEHNAAPFSEIAYQASKVIFAADIPDQILEPMVREAFNFPVPLVELDSRTNILELFHGPTCAFKDFAARFMARLFGYFLEQSQQSITILVATSGDTGSAVAHGFLNVPGVNVVILYPSGKVSSLQEKQLTAMGGNITALEIEGTFDDCQALVKQAFVDVDLTKHFNLASANSINIARLLPQALYYIYLGAQMQKYNQPLVVSVPSGNFGNLTAGLIAKKMGTPIEKFIAATNENDTVPTYLETGTFTAQPSVSTISNAMDVGNPSNFDRMHDLYGGDVSKMRQDIIGTHFSDTETTAAMVRVYEKYNYILDPHGAVGYLGWQSAQKQLPNSIGVILETAHPAKFGDIVEPVLGVKVPMPPQLQMYVEREKMAVQLPNSFVALKEYLLSTQA